MADMNGVQRREVMRTDDPFGIPACFYWTVDEVADWIESIGYGKYKENFRSHFINGRKLLTVDACVLPRMGITHFGDILDLAGEIRNKLTTGRLQKYRMPELQAEFERQFAYESAPLDGLHPEALAFCWCPQVVLPQAPAWGWQDFVTSGRWDAARLPVGDRQYSYVTTDTLTSDAAAPERVCPPEEF